MVSPMRRPSQVIATLVAGAFVCLTVVFVLGADSAAQTPTYDATVTVKDLAFDPAAVSLPHSGMTVRWTHGGGNNVHSVTFDKTEGQTDFDSHPNCTPSTPDDCFKKGDQDIFVEFRTAGDFKYHCKIHSQMTGVVSVAGVVPTTPGSATTTTRAGGTTTTRATTGTTVGTLTTTSEVTTTSVESSTTSSSSTSTTLGFTTQTTSSALGSNSDDDDDNPSGVLEAVGVLLLAAVVAALIPAWRRLT
jgi:plastocyanin